MPGFWLQFSRFLFSVGSAGFKFHFSMYDQSVAHKLKTCCTAVLLLQAWNWNPPWMSGGWVFKWWCNSGGEVLPMVTADFRGRWCPKWPRKLWRNMWTIPSPCQVYKLTVCWYPAISLEMTLDIFHLPEARVLSFESFWYLKLFLFRIKSHPGVCHKSVSYKKVCNVVF